MNYFNYVLVLMILLNWVHCEKEKKECRYEKANWQECDPKTGLQKRSMKLKASRSGKNCDPVKEVTRPCKKVCKYTKGNWSECVDGERTRTDTLNKALSTNNCQATRVMNKICKSVCRYSKAKWSPCVNGTKTKTVKRLEGEGPDCKPERKIEKNCGPHGNKRQKEKKKDN